MRSTQEKAYGKLNLTLEVCGRRPDGYHDMRMVMQTVSLCDSVTVTVESGRGWEVRTDSAAIPNGEGNLAWKAAEVFRKAAGIPLPDVEIEIQKVIPSQAGMAGGSSDAAAVLRALNRLCGEPLTRERLAAESLAVGSDVPYCVMGGTMLAEGRGERLTALPALPPCCFVLCKPAFSISTPALFRALDAQGGGMAVRPEEMPEALRAQDLAAVGAALCNAFEPVAAAQYPVIREIVRELRAHGALGAALTGTGSVVYGLFPDEKSAAAARSALPAFCGRTWLAANI